MTINLDTEVVGSTYDVSAHVSTYTVLRDGRRWTVTVPDVAFAQCQNAASRRTLLGNLLTNAMRGKADGES